MKSIVIAALVFALFLVVLLLQNLGGAGIGILFWDVEAPLSLLLVGFYVLGGLTARPLVRFLHDFRIR